MGVMDVDTLMRLWTILNIILQTEHENSTYLLRRVADASIIYSKVGRNIIQVIGTKFPICNTKLSETDIIHTQDQQLYTKKLR